MAGRRAALLEAEHLDERLVAILVDDLRETVLPTDLSESILPLLPFARTGLRAAMLAMTFVKDKPTPGESAASLRLSRSTWSTRLLVAAAWLIISHIRKSSATSSVPKWLVSLCGVLEVAQYVALLRGTDTRTIAHFLFGLHYEPVGFAAEVGGADGEAVSQWANQQLWISLTRTAVSAALLLQFLRDDNEWSNWLGAALSHVRRWLRSWGIGSLGETAHPAAPESAFLVRARALGHAREPSGGDEGTICAYCRRRVTSLVLPQCGHPACYVCLWETWRQYDGDVSCPECGERTTAVVRL